MTPEERALLQREIGAYLDARIADANDLQCTVWAGGICDIVDEVLLVIIADVIEEFNRPKEGDVESSS